MYLKKIILFITLPVFVLLNSCRSEPRNIDIDLEYNENNKSSILFETEPGCSKTNFEFKKAFSEEIGHKKNCFIASNFTEFEGTIKRYFEMDFLNTITPEYFKQNNLVIIIIDSLYDSEYLRNGRIIKSNDKKYIFKIEIWNRINPLSYFNKCLYTKIFILEIGKK